jgi:hypothetical protein
LEALKSFEKDMADLDRLSELVKGADEAAADLAGERAQALAIAPPELVGRLLEARNGHAERLERLKDDMGRLRRAAEEAEEAERAAGADVEEANRRLAEVVDRNMEGGESLRGQWMERMQALKALMRELPKIREDYAEFLAYAEENKMVFEKMRAAGVGGADGLAARSKELYARAMGVLKEYDAILRLLMEDAEKAQAALRKRVAV